MGDGFSLLEVLISLILLSIITLGFGAAEIEALRTTRAAHDFSIAVNQVTNAKELLRILEPRQKLNQIITRWNDENQQVLPQGRGDISGNFPRYTIRVYWGEKQNECDQPRWGTTGCLRLDIRLHVDRVNDSIDA
jgi:prepilin-type N-terminal cleavage/methylation domain-containing protein